MGIPDRIYLVLLLALGAASHLHGQSRIIYPNGGEVFRPGDDIGIRWEGIAPSERVSLLYSTDDGSSWSRISASASDLEHQWRVPQRASERCRVMLMRKQLETLVINSYPDRPSNASYSSDERFIVAQGRPESWRPFVLIKDAGSGMDLWELKEGTWARPNPMHNTVVTVERSTATLRDIATGTPIAILQEHSGVVMNARFTPDGSKLVSVGSDGRLMLWDGITGAYRMTLSGHGGQVSYIRFSRTGEYAVTISGADRSVRVWDLTAGRLLQSYFIGAASAALNPDGSRALSTNFNDSGVHLWDVASGKELKLLRGELFATFSPDGTQILAGSNGDTASVYDAASGSLLYVLKDFSRFTGAVYSPDGTHIAMFNYNGSITIWDARTGQLKKTLDGHLGVVNSAEFSKDGRRLLSAADDQTVKVWAVDDTLAMSDISDAPFTIVPMTTGAPATDGRAVAGVSIRPNPAGNWVEAIVKEREGEVVRVAIRDMLGLLRKEERFRVTQAGEERVRIDVSDLPSGRYLLILDSPAGRVSSPLSIVR